jgi:hypothetical protein
VVAVALLAGRSSSGTGPVIAEITRTREAVCTQARFLTRWGPLPRERRSDADTARQYILRRRNPKSHAYGRIDGFKDRYKTGIAMCNEPLPRVRPAPWQNPMKVEIAIVARELRNAVKRYWPSTVYFDETKEAYKELEKSLEYIEDDIYCHEKHERLSAKLLALEKALADLTAFLNTTLSTPVAARFAVPLAALLEGPTPGNPRSQDRTLVVGQALATADAADAATGLIASWTVLAQELVTYVKWWLRLDQAREQGSASNTSAWEPDHLVELSRARTWLAQAEYELLNVADANGLVQLDTAADLKRAYRRLAYLSDQHGNWPLRQKSSPGDEAQTPSGVTRYAGGTPTDKEPTVQHWVAEADEVERTPAGAPKLKDAKIRLLAGWFAVPLTASAAVTTALAGFYFSENSGTTEDYLTIIVAAGIAQVIVQTITEAVRRTLVPMPKQLITGPVAAIVKPPAAKAALVGADYKPAA